MSTGSGFALRSRMRLICCIMAGALLVFALGASSAEAKVKKPKHLFYLALGDSISYGYSLVKFDENLGPCAKGLGEPGCEPPSAFEPGLENYVFGKESKKGVKPSKKVSTINLSCPGETSSGLIGHNVAFGGGAGAEFNPCGWHNTNGFRRHYEYGSVSQLEAAAAFITGNPEKTAAAISLVSLNIGSNDELHVLGECRNSLYRESKGYATEAECVEKEAPALFGKILSNMGHTVGVLRAAGYTGHVVILGFYNPFGVLVHSTDALQEALNGELENQVGKGTFGPGVKVANPYATFNDGHEGGEGEKASLTANTEFYNPAAIADELASTTKGLEEHGGECKKAKVAGKGAFNNPGCTEPGGSKEFEKASPSLGELTAFLEAFGAGCEEPKEPSAVRPKFEDSKCEIANPSGKFQKAVPTLAEAIAEQEAEGEPNLATVTKAQEENGKPNLAEVTGFTEAFGSCSAKLGTAKGRFKDAHCTEEEVAKTGGEYERTSPNLKEATEFTEKFGTCSAKLGTGKGRFKDPACTEEELTKTGGEYERTSPNLEEAIAAHEAEAHAGYVAACEGKGKSNAECEAAWLSAGKAEYEAGVKAAFDHAVKVGFDAAVKAGFDAAVKAGFDAGVKFFYDAKVQHAFQAEVKKGFEAAGSPGDIHPSKAGYKALGNLVKANK